MKACRMPGRALLAATALAATAIAAPASAQRIDNIIAFGDSYADEGNAFQLGYANPQALAVYPTGRFSGGSNYIDTLSTLLNVPMSNFAIGGAFGGSNNGTLCFDPFYAPGTSPLCGLGLQYEVDQFLNVGTQSTAFPAVPTTFSAGDLLTVSIGGNDARFYQQAGGTLALAPTAGAAAAVNTSLSSTAWSRPGRRPSASLPAIRAACPKWPRSRPRPRSEAPIRRRSTPACRRLSPAMPPTA